MLPRALRPLTAGVARAGSRPAPRCLQATRCLGTTVSQFESSLLPSPANRGREHIDSVVGVSKLKGETLSFDDGRKAYKSKTDNALLRAVVVMHLCNVTSLVKLGAGLLKGIKTLGLQGVAEAPLNATFFGHFCGGRDAEEIKPTIDMLASYGIGAILDYAAEADVTVAAGGKGATVYSEHECDANADISKLAIDAASYQERGFAAVKMTALGRPELLHHVSAILTEVRSLFDSLTDEQSDEFVDTQLSWEQFQAGVAKLGWEDARITSREYFDDVDIDKSGSIDYVEWIDSLNPLVLATLPVSKWVRTPTLSEEELGQMRAMYTRLEELVDRAEEKGVRIMVDAEQSYMQPAIDHVVLHLQRKYNKGGKSVVFNTYQAYLKDCYRRLQIDLSRAKREGFTLSAKLVRGAYMVQERLLARELAHPDKNEHDLVPVCSSKADTDTSYSRCLELLFDCHDSSEIVVASHNEGSVRQAVDLMEKHGLPRRNGGVYFGQLLGMCDNVSFALGEAGYQVYKYVPYGPVFEVMPYLIRRAEENSSMMTGATKERRLLREELCRRM